MTPVHPRQGEGVAEAVERVTAALRLWTTSGQPDDTLIYSDNHGDAVREIAENGGVTCISDPDFTIADVKAFLSALSSQAEALEAMVDAVAYHEGEGGRRSYGLRPTFGPAYQAARTALSTYRQTKEDTA